MDALRFVEHCIDTYAERAWRMAYAMLSNVHDADDLLQQAFLIAWRKADSAPRENPWPWLAAIIAGEAYNARRKRSRRAAAPLDQAGDPAMQANQQRELEQAELHALVHLALNELSPEQRIAIVLTHLSGLTQEQAAKAVGVPLDTLKARVRRGMDKLREVVRTDDSRIEHLLLTLPAAFGAGGLAALKAGWLAHVQSEAALAATATVATASTGKLLFACVAVFAVAALVAGALTMPADRPVDEPPQHDLAARKQSSTRPLSAHQAGDVAADEGNGSDAADLEVQDPPAEPANIGTPGEIGSINPWADPKPKDTEPKDEPPPLPASLYPVYRVMGATSADASAVNLERALADKRLSNLDKYRALLGSSLAGVRIDRLLVDVLEDCPWQIRAEVVRQIIESDDTAWQDQLHKWVMDERNISRHPGAGETLVCALMRTPRFQTVESYRAFGELAMKTLRNDRNGQVFVRVAQEFTDVPDGDTIGLKNRVDELVKMGESAAKSPELQAFVLTGLERLTGISATNLHVYKAQLLKPVADEAVTLTHGDLQLQAVRRALPRNSTEVVVLPDFGLNFDLSDPHLMLLARGRNCLFVNLPTSPDHKGVERYGEDGFFIPIDAVVAALEAYRVAQGGRKIGLIAHGLSGWIAMEYMKKHPDGVAYAVMVGTWMGDDYSAAVKRLTETTKKGDTGLQLVGQQMLGNARHDDAQVFDYARAEIAMRRNSGGASLSLALRAAKCIGSGRVLVPEFEDGKAPWDGLADVSVHRLFVWGEDDPMFVTPDSRLASGARVEKIKDAGREAWADAPDEFGAALAGFFLRYGVR